LKWQWVDGKYEGKFRGQWLLVQASTSAPRMALSYRAGQKEIAAMGLQAGNFTLTFHDQLLP